MKASNGETIRIGFGLGTTSTTNQGPRLNTLIDGLEQLGFDSVWFSERVAGANLDPLIAMTWAAARTERLKFGPSVMVVPGRNPVLLAKALASLDRVSNGRLLPAFGLGAVNLAEHQAFGVRRDERSAWFDEALPLLRRLWTEDDVDHDGDRFHLHAVKVRPHPVQDPLSLWLGGQSKGELRRVGRLGDGWLPSFCTPTDVADGIPLIDAASETAGRPMIDRGHIGALIMYAPDGSIPDRIRQAVELRRPGVDPEAIVVAGRERLPGRIAEFCDAGATKFVLMPATEPDEWTSELELLATHVLHFHT